MTQQADKQISVKLCKQIVFALILFSVGRSRAQDFFSKPLPAPNQPDALSEVATSSAFHGDSIYVATEATLADGRKTIRLYKIDADEQVVWVVDSNFSGSVHALSTAADPETGSVSAFVAISSVYKQTRQIQGQLLRFDDIHKDSLPNDPKEVFKVLSSEYHSQIRACKAVNETGRTVVYIAGGSSGSLFRTRDSVGKTEMFVARVGYDGLLESAIQKASDTAEYAVALELDQDRSELLVASVRDGVSGHSVLTSLHILHPKTYEDLTVPVTVTSYGYNLGNSIAFDPKLARNTNTSAVFISGTASIAGARKSDMFCNVYTRVGNSSGAFALYFDGAHDRRDIDYGASVRSINDGNAYVMGYSQDSDNPDISFPVLTVIAPTGKMLLRSSPSNFSGYAQEIRDMIVQGRNGSFVTAYYFGSFRLPLDANITSKAMMGRVTVEVEKIPVFEGFGGLVNKASANNVPTETPAGAKSAESTNISGYVIGALVGLSCLVVVAATVSLVSRKKEHSEDSLSFSN